MPVIFDRPLFGDKIRVIVYNLKEEEIKNILEQMYLEALRLQKIFNFFDKESELSILNERRNLKVSTELLEVIKRSIAMSKLTKGDYDISLGRRILLRKKGIPIKKTNCSYKDISIKGKNITLTNPEVLLDLGSIAKGYITDKLSHFLKDRGINEFLIDSRGDILFSGVYSHIIGIQDPRNKDRNICSIKIKDMAIATSGDYMQYYGKFENSHILNSKDSISVTVISKTLEEADLLATSIFVSDKKDIKKITNFYKECPVLVIKKDLSQEYYNRFRMFIL